MGNKEARPYFLRRFRVSPPYRDTGFGPRLRRRTVPTVSLPVKLAKFEPGKKLMVRIKLVLVVKQLQCEYNGLRVLEM